MNRERATGLTECIVDERGDRAVDLPSRQQRRDTVNNHLRLEYAAKAITNMVAEAVREGQSGTIGIEIPVKDGKLGKVKRVQILFQDK